MTSTDHSSPIIPKTQKAAVLEEFSSPYTIKADHRVKQPSELAPGECLVKLEYSGICHSDLHIRNADWPRKVKLPLVGGHEGIGRVVAIGEHTSSNVKVGDRVGVKWIANVSCPTSIINSHGYMLDGTFQEYVVSFTNYVTPIPEGMDGASATPIFLEANQLSVAIQYAVAMGLRVLAIGKYRRNKKNLCLSLGAEKWAATDGLGPEAAVIAAGDARPFNQAIMYLRSKGTLVCVGMPAGNAMLNVPVILLIARSLTILGSSIGNQQDVTEALRIAALGKVKCQHEVKRLEDLNRIVIQF
ncbi:chaperonin 10-like protein [Flammula alnicola]|nr:chaperonin 10-like protein [Flammula alnicola]